MPNNMVETLMAAAVLLIAAGFLFFMYNSTRSGIVNGYEIAATLGSVDGIAAGSDVRLHSIKIGTVTAIDLNRKTYKPVAHLSIRDDIRIPYDSTARIASAGILNGSVFLAIEPGHSSKMLPAGAAWSPR